MVRDRATDWLELEENMANMTVDDRHNGKLLTKLLAHPAIRAKHQIVSTKCNWLNILLEVQGVKSAEIAIGQTCVD